MSETVEHTFSEILETIVDNRGRTCPITELGFPLIATNCIKNDGLYPEFINVRYVDNETYSNWFRGHPKPDDLIFVLKGTPGRVCYTPNPVNFCIAQDMVALRPKKNIVDSKYLFAVLRSKQIQERIESLHVGSLIPHFKKGDFDKLKIPIIQNPEKRKFIGNLYFDLSLKIELNNKINQELETLAQTLFKQWFIDFEFPNENGEPYKSSGGEMMESELGEIPKGWKIDSLDNIAEFLNGLALQKFPAESDYEFLPVIKIRELRQKDTTNSDKASVNIPEKYIIEDGDVLFSWSGSLMIDFWTNGKGALNQHLFKVTSEEYPKWYYYLWTKHHLTEFIAIAESKATTMGHIQRQHLTNAKVLVPAEDIITNFSLVFEPIISKIINNRIECVELIKLRDTLLPKLISGELEINAITN